jgi:prolyl-tRNA editing enzyme YbaK/EbsC (Cys-tRNA(Pro) deacylase)
MQFGKLYFNPLSQNSALVAHPIQQIVKLGMSTDGIFVSAIDARLADTSAFCEAYDVAPESGANCIIVEAKRGDRVWYAACLILATDMTDVNNKVRRYLDARKISFAAKDIALELTGMEYGGIAPIGLPDEIPLLIDEKVIEKKRVIVGSGLRKSKILVNSDVLRRLNNATIVHIAK